MATKMCFAVGRDVAFEEEIVEFEYIKGMAFSQKQKNVLSFHKSIQAMFPNSRIVEISTKSQHRLLSMLHFSWFSHSQSTFSLGFT